VADLQTAREFQTKPLTMTNDGALTLRRPSIALLKEVVTAGGKRLATGATVNVGERGGREY
jgi:hypothetical protein